MPESTRTRVAATTAAHMSTFSTFSSLRRFLASISLWDFRFCNESSSSSEKVLSYFGELRSPDAGTPFMLSIHSGRSSPRSARARRAYSVRGWTLGRRFFLAILLKTASGGVLEVFYASRLRSEAQYQGGLLEIAILKAVPATGDRKNGHICRRWGAGPTHAPTACRAEVWRAYVYAKLVWNRQFSPAG